VDAERYRVITLHQQVVNLFVIDLQEGAVHEGLRVGVLILLLDEAENVVNRSRNHASIVTVRSDVLEESRLVLDLDWTTMPTRLDHVLPIVTEHCVGLASMFINEGYLILSTRRPVH
jgi:hypothetical protein